MEQAAQTMLDNLRKNTGKSLEEWIEILKAKNFPKHGDIMKFLKEEHDFTHGFANMVALKARAADSGSFENTDELIENQYKGKEQLRPIYEILLKYVKSLGSDVEIAPKKAYVSLRRKKQFAALKPATKTRFEISLNLKDQGEKGKLKVVNTSNAMFSHFINVHSTEEVDNEILNWLKVAYEKAV
jgi:predicted transport protein